MRERIEDHLGRERGIIGANWLERFPIESYVQWFSAAATAGNYGLFPGSLAPWFASIAEEAGHEMLSAYHRLALLELMHRSLEILDRGQVVLAPTVHQALHEWFKGVLDRLEAEPDLHLDADSDFFKKDISICALRLLPTRGPCHFEQGWIGRKFLVQGGMRQVLAAAHCLLVDLRLERKKLYTLHVEDRLVYRNFLEEGWLRTYQDIAAQLRLDPHIKALFAAAWFYDPRLREISPRMAYLYDVPKIGGARFFRAGRDAATFKDALTNPKRRRLYEAGEYLPTNYLMIWPRTKFLAAV